MWEKKSFTAVISYVLYGAVEMQIPSRCARGFHAFRDLHARTCSFNIDICDLYRIGKLKAFSLKLGRAERMESVSRYDRPT